MKNYFESIIAGAFLNNPAERTQINVKRKPIATTPSVTFYDKVGMIFDLNCVMQIDAHPNCHKNEVFLSSI